MEDATKTSSFMHADRLTHSLPHTLNGETIPSSEPIMLNLLLETHRHTGAEIARTRTEAVHVAEYTTKIITEWRDLAFLELLPEMALADEAAQEVLGPKLLFGMISEPGESSCGRGSRVTCARCQEEPPEATCDKKVSTSGRAELVSVHGDVADWQLQHGV
jgi:hypothetical protein